jgi:hypothetical protein
MLVAQNQEMVPVAKTRDLYAPRHPFSEWVTRNNEIARNPTKLVVSTPTPVFGMGDVLQRNYAKPPQT